MAYLAVDKNGRAFIYNTRPVREDDYWQNFETWVSITPESAEKLFGGPMSWEDEPIEI